MVEMIRPEVQDHGQMQAGCLQVIQRLGPVCRHDFLDTFDFNLGTVEPGDKQIKDGTFNLFVYNGYPISATPQLYYYDDYFIFIDSLYTTAQTAEAGTLDDQCMVSEKTKSVLSATVDENKMSRLRAASKVIVVSRFNTASHPNCDYVKIYDNYSMDIQLTGLFTFFTGY